MNEFLINYRNTSTGDLVNVHICNVDNANEAIFLANNSQLSDDVLEYDSAYQLIHRSPLSTGIPF